VFPQLTFTGTRFGVTHRPIHAQKEHPGFYFDPGDAKEVIPRLDLSCVIACRVDEESPDIEVDIVVGFRNEGESKVQESIGSCGFKKFDGTAQAQVEAILRRALNWLHEKITEFDKD